jgi:hypothetical protein
MITTARIGLGVPLSESYSIDKYLSDKQRGPNPKGKCKSCGKDCYWTKVKLQAHKKCMHKLTQ